MKVFIVKVLNKLCDIDDRVIIDRLPVRIAASWNHPLVLLSIKLDEKWKTGVWNEPSA